ncbi:MAG: hypothetical protein ABI134_14160 [Byssovorax sp.]
MRVFLSGEGPDDLGDWCNDPQYRSNPPRIGVIEALLRNVSKVDFTIVDARVWKRIRKFKAGKHAQPETRNVLGLMLEAEEARCDALVFVRDQDGYADRQASIETGILLANDGDYEPALVGGVAIQEIEAWILALLGERSTERHADAKAVLVKRHSITSCAEKVAAVESADRSKIPEDALSLLTWLAQVDACFLSRP